MQQTQKENEKYLQNNARPGKKEEQVWQHSAVSLPAHHKLDFMTPGLHPDCDQEVMLHR